MNKFKDRYRHEIGLFLYFISAESFGYVCILYANYLHRGFFASFFGILGVSALFWGFIGLIMMLLSLLDII
jgi:hypothetical protein